MKLDVVINGRVLLLPLNGIPRYAHEVIRQLDKTLAKKYKVAVVIPKDSLNKRISFENIAVVELTSKCIGWDYLCAEKYARNNDAIYIDFASKGTLYHKGITTFHDIRPISYDKYNSRKSITNKLKFGISFYLAVLFSKKIVTDSKWSKKEIMDKTKISPERVNVIGAGWEHITNCKSNNEIFGSFSEIKKGEYYLAIGSIAPHKNYKWIIDNAKFNPHYQFVIIGGKNNKLWEDVTAQFKRNILFVGYQTDECIKALLENAKALVFPSFYEGFGIPPLEALSLGTKAIVSDIPVMHEIFSECAYYIDPLNPNINLDDFLQTTIQKPNDLLGKYSWKKSAQMWSELIIHEIESKTL